MLASLPPNDVVERYKSLADIERGFRVLRVGDRNRPGVPPLAGSYSRPCSHLLYGADPGSGDARTAARPICAACRQSGRCPCWAGSSTTVSRSTKPNPFQESPRSVRSKQTHDVSAPTLEAANKSPHPEYPRLPSAPMDASNPNPSLPVKAQPALHCRPDRLG